MGHVSTFRKSLNCKIFACPRYLAYVTGSGLVVHGIAVKWLPTTFHRAFESIEAILRPQEVAARVLWHPDYADQLRGQVQLWKKLANQDYLVSSRKVLRPWRPLCHASRMSTSLTSIPESSSLSHSWSSILLIGASMCSKSRTMKFVPPIIRTQKKDIVVVVKVYLGNNIASPRSRTTNFSSVKFRQVAVTVSRSQTKLFLAC